MAFIITEVTAQLASFLKTKIPDAQVLSEFPDPSQSLSYPTISISAMKPQFSPRSHVVLGETVISETQSKIIYATGIWDLPLQIDLWANSKFQRAKFAEKLFDAFCSEAPSSGISLKLTRVFDIVCSYVLDSISEQDDEMSSQTKNWRAMAFVDANCFSVVEKTVSVIAETELTSEITSSLTGV